MALNNQQNWRACNQSLPMLFLTGSKDPLSDGGKMVNQLIRQLQAIGIHNVQHEIIDDARHKVEYDTEADKVLSIIRKWLNKKVK